MCMLMDVMNFFLSGFEVFKYFSINMCFNVVYLKLVVVCIILFWKILD